MKKFLCLILGILFSFPAFADEFVEVTSVTSAPAAWANRDVAMQIVKVKLTDYAMQSNQATFVVNVEPKRNIWDFLIDLRGPETITLSKQNHSGEVVFKCGSKHVSSCGNRDFNSWVSRGIY